MTLFNDRGRLAPIRTGKYAEVASSLAWFIGLLATYVHPMGLVVAGILLGLTASSKTRAFAASAAFGITVVAAGAAWLVLTGAFPVQINVAPAFVGFLALFVPPFFAVTLRSVL